MSVGVEEILDGLLTSFGLRRNEENRDRLIDAVLKADGSLVEMFPDDPNTTKVEVDISELLKDRDRLNWLIDNGYSPAKWRSPINRAEYNTRASSNGMIYEGRGGREEIDKAMTGEAATLAVKKT